jgi:transcriptional regulator with XRE-family HTH domain
MAANERLRTAMIQAGLTVAGLAEAAGVDPKTCERWITMGRTPHRVNAQHAAAAVGEDLAYLWPALEGGRRRGIDPDVIAVYPSRAGTPLETWRAIFEHAAEDIGILVYAAVFLHEIWPDFTSLLKDRAAAGCRVRILLGDPEGQAVARRGWE